jgi:hypothetical protein
MNQKLEYKGWSGVRKLEAIQGWRKEEKFPQYY